MNPSKFLRSALTLITFLLIAGCTLRQNGIAPNFTPVPVSTATFAPAATPVPTDIPAPASAPTSAAVTPTAAPSEATLQPATAAAQAYASALQAGDFTAAAGMLSNFSLTAAQITGSSAAASLATQKAAGAAWSGFEIQPAQPFDPHTALVKVRFQAAVKDAKTGQVTQQTRDEVWPLRLEDGAWRYNWQNLIDTRTLDVKEAVTAGMTVKPLRMERYTDRIVLTLLVQNGTNDAIVWGSPSEVISTFHFGEKSVAGDKNRLIFDRLRSYPDTEITVSGLFSTYPDSVELRKFTNYNVAPWFNFPLTS